MVALNQNLISIFKQSHNLSDQMELTGEALILEVTLSKQLGRLMTLFPNELSPTGEIYSGISSESPTRFTDQCGQSKSMSVLRYTFIVGPLIADQLQNAWDESKKPPARMSYSDNLQSPISTLIHSGKTSEVTLIDSELGLYRRFNATVKKVFKSSHSADVELKDAENQNYETESEIPTYFPPRSLVYTTQTRDICISKDKNKIISFPDDAPASVNILMNLANSKKTFDGLKIEFGRASHKTGKYEIVYDEKWAKKTLCAQVLRLSLYGHGENGVQRTLYSKAIKLKGSRLTEDACKE